MEYEPKNAEIVTPEPYFKVAFGCSNRAFYTIKSELYAIGEKIGIEVQDGYVTEKCDYEGDLEEILIYNGEREKPLVDATLDFYGVDREKLPNGMNLMLSIF